MAAASAIYFELHNSSPEIYGEVMHILSIFILSVVEPNTRNCQILEVQIINWDINWLPGPPVCNYQVNLWETAGLEKHKVHWS